MFLPPLVVLGGPYGAALFFFRPVGMLLRRDRANANIATRSHFGCERMFLSSFVVLGLLKPLFLCHPAPMQRSTETLMEVPTPSREMVRAYWQDSGAGPIGIFLPGFASDLRGSKSQLLAERAQQSQRSWLRFDYRGMGISDGDFTALTISRYVEDIGAIIRALPSRSLLLVGSSMGGWVATRAAQLWPDRVRALVLIAPAFNFIQDYYAALSPSAQSEWQRSGTHAWQLGAHGPVFSLGFSAVEDAARHDLLAAPPRLDIPVTILHGSDDDAVPLQRSFDFACHACASLLAIQTLQGVGHRLQGAEPQLLSAVDSSFLRITHSG